MKLDLLSILVCPTDKGPLTLTDEGAAMEGDDVVTGNLVCIECGSGYPIRNSIPNLLPESARG